MRLFIEQPKKLEGMRKRKKQNGSSRHRSNNIVLSERSIRRYDKSTQNRV